MDIHNHHSCLLVQRTSDIGNLGRKKKGNWGRVKKKIKFNTTLNEQSSDTETKARVMVMQNSHPSPFGVTLARLSALTLQKDEDWGGGWGFGALERANVTIRQAHFSASLGLMIVRNGLS